MLLIVNISYRNINLRHKTFPGICSSLPECKSSFLAYYFASFSRFPRILCMHLFYFDTSLNINKPPGYNNTHPCLRTNYIQRKKCHKCNDFTYVAIKNSCLVFFYSERTKLTPLFISAQPFSFPYVAPWLLHKISFYSK